MSLLMLILISEIYLKKGYLVLEMNQNSKSLKKHEHMHTIKMASLFLLAGMLMWSSCAKEELFTSDQATTDETEGLLAGQGQGDLFAGSLEDMVSLEEILKGPIPPGYVLQPIIGAMQINGNMIYQSPEPPIFRMWGDSDISGIGTTAYIESYYVGEGDSFFGGEGILSQINPDGNGNPANASSQVSFYSLYQYSEEEESGLVHYSKLLFFEGSGAFQGAYGSATRKLHFTDPENFAGTIELFGYVLIPE
jgi:hypothetical protein